MGRYGFVSELFGIARFSRFFKNRYRTARSVWGPFGMRSGSVQIPFRVRGIRSGYVRGPFGVCSGSVRDLHGSVGNPFVVLQFFNRSLATVFEVPILPPSETRCIQFQLIQFIQKEAISRQPRRRLCKIIAKKATIS